MATTTDVKRIILPNGDICNLRDDSKQPIIVSVAVTLLSSGWSSDSQTVTATGVTASNSVIVSPSPSDSDAYSSAGIKCTAQGSNTLTFTCSTAPSSNLSVNVLIID